MGLAERLCVGRRTPASTARCDQRLVSYTGSGCGRRRGGVCLRVLAGSRAAGIGRTRAGLVECAGALYGPGPAVCQRAAFPHGLGGLCLVGVFPDHARTGTAPDARGGLALPGGVARRNARAVRFFLPAGSAHGKLGARPHAGPSRAGPVVLGSLVRVRREGRHVSAPHLAAIRPRECSQPCLGDHVWGGDQDGALRSGPLQWLAARPGERGLGGADAGCDQRGAGCGVHAGAKRPQAAARLLLGGKHRGHPDRPRSRTAGRGQRQHSLGPRGDGGSDVALVESRPV